MPGRRAAGRRAGPLPGVGLRRPARFAAGVAATMAGVAAIASPRRRISRAGKVQLGLVGVNVAFWGAILGWTAFGDHPDRRPDQLTDRRFPQAAEAVCAEALADIEALDLDPVADSPEERADTVDVTNERLRQMVAELRTLPRPDGEEGEWVASWLDDWETHIADRQRWADEQRAGIDRPFSESDRAGVQVSKVVDNFAEVNDMPSCATTHDV